VGSRLLEHNVLLLFMPFFNSSSANAVDMKELSIVYTPLRTKTGFYYVHNHLSFLSDLLLLSVVPVYTCNFKPYTVSVSHKSVLSNHTTMACMLCWL
jgi:hypothetical protein